MLNLRTIFQGVHELHGSARAQQDLGPGGPAGKAVAAVELPGTVSTAAAATAASYGTAAHWRRSERRIAVDRVDALLARADAACASAEVAEEWGAAVAILDEAMIVAPEMRGMEGAASRVARMNEAMAHAHAMRQRCEAEEKAGASKAATQRARAKQADKLMRDFERAQAKGRFKGKLARWSKRAAPVFVELTDHDRDTAEKPLFEVDDVIQVAESDGRFFIATVVSYTTADAEDPFRLEYRWRNGQYGALRVDPNAEDHQRAKVRRRLPPEEAAVRAQEKAEREGKELAAREQLVAAGLEADEEAVQRLLATLDAAKDEGGEGGGGGGGGARGGRGDRAGQVGKVHLNARFVLSAEQEELEQLREHVSVAAKAAFSHGVSHLCVRCRWLGGSMH
jgi:hypothetical protein